MAQLDVILQHQLSTDERAVANVLIVVSQLTPSHLSSPRLLVARIHSLLQKPVYPGARWAGFCLAYRVASLSSEVLTENAKSWISSALPALSRDEPPPVHIEAMRLLHLIFTSALDMPEFHRQVVTPNLQKFSIALLQLAENLNTPNRVMVFAFRILTHMVSSFPAAHVSLTPRLTKLALFRLSRIDGQLHNSESLLASSSAILLSALHIPGGKARSVLLWRKTLEDTLNSIIVCVEKLRTAFKVEAKIEAPLPSSPGLELPTIPEDASPALVIPLVIDRLRSLVSLLVKLLSATSSRPLVLPLGPIASVVDRLLSVTTMDPHSDPHVFVDPLRRSMEVSAIPSLLEIGCDLYIALINSTSHHVTPYIPKISSLIAWHLEQDYPPTTRLALLRAVSISLSVPSHMHPIAHTPYLPGRFIRALLVPMLKILPSRSGADVSPPKPTDDYIQANGSKGNKKDKGGTFEGDELLRPGAVGSKCLNPDVQVWQEVLVSLDALKPLLLIPSSTSSAIKTTSGQSPPSFAPLQSITLRILTSLLLSLPHHSHALPHRQQLHTVLDKITQTCEDVILRDGGTGGDEWLRKNLSILIRSTANAAAHDHRQSSLVSLNLLLHPRVPPHLGLPPTWSSSLSSARTIKDILLFRESKEEREVRLSLGISLAADEKMEDTVEGAATTDQIIPVSLVPKPLWHSSEDATYNVLHRSIISPTIEEDSILNAPNIPRPWSPSVPQPLVTTAAPVSITAPTTSNHNGQIPLLPETGMAAIETAPNVPISPRSTQNVFPEVWTPPRPVHSDDSSMVEDGQTIKEQRYNMLPAPDGEDDDEVGSLPEIIMGSDEE